MQAMQAENLQMRTRSAVRRLGLVALMPLSLASIAVSAAPLVDGLSIVMPDDGWYQVQSSTDYRQICGGVTRCPVEAGVYIVINHTTGERFEGVSVGLEPVDGDRIVVSDDGISWPDDGWYQVQRASDYESLCQGGRRCSLVPGNYIVINHTTGQRWETVRVPGEEVAGLQAVDLRYQRYSVSAIELFWDRQAGAQLPIEYRVFQDGMPVGSTEGVSFFIEGLSDDRAHEFEVRPFDNAEGVSIIVQPSTDSDVSDEGPVLNLANAERILAEVVAVINEEAIDAIFDNAAQDLNFQGKTFFISNTIDDIVFVDGGEQLPAYPLENVYGSGIFTDATQYAEYSCAAGGGLTNYYALVGNASDAVFDNCVAGSNTYNGTTGIRNIQRGVINRFPVRDFSVTDSLGQTRTVSGEYAAGNLSFVVINAQSGWSSADYRGPWADGELHISNYSVVRTEIDNQSGIGSTTRPGDDGELIRVIQYRVENAVSGEFAVSAPWSGNQELQVTLGLSFSDNAVIASDPDSGEPVAYSGADPEEAFYWQDGSIEVMAEDGSRLSMTPVQGDRDAFLITNTDGDTLGPLLWEDGYAVQP